MKILNVIIAVISLTVPCCYLYAEIGLNHPGTGSNVAVEFVKTLDFDLNFDSCVYILSDIDLYQPRIDDLQYSLEVERSA